MKSLRGAVKVGRADSYGWIRICMHILYVSAWRGVQEGEIIAEPPTPYILLK